MKIGKVSGLLLVVIALSVGVVSPCFAQQWIQGVEVQGNRRIDSETVLLQVSSKKGEILNPELVEQDIKTVYRTGFFEQVQAIQKRTSSGVVLVFVVTEKPAIHEIKIEGTDNVSEDTFREKLKLDTLRFFDKKRVDSAVAQVRDHYQTQGYYDVDISYKLVPVKENQVNLKFVVKENEQKLIRKLNFEGNNSVDDSDLREVIKTSRYKWWSSWITGGGIVKKEQLEEDVKGITRLYLTKGHLDVRVNQPVVENREEGLFVTYKIQEGPVYRIGKIGVRGDLISGSSAKTLSDIESEKGEILNVDLLRKDTFKIADKFTDIGYAFANVEPLTDVDRANRQVAVTFVVNKGQLIRVNRINITGNEKTQDNVVRRSLKITEGEIFSSSKIRRSQELLQRLGYFDQVSITPEPALQEDEVDLGVSVREGTTGSFTIGGGISSSDGFIFTSRVAENNIFGTGNSVSLDASLGSERENFVLSFNNPMVNDSPWSFGADLLSVMRRFDDFDRSQAGASVDVGYPLWFLGPEYLDDIRFTLGYELMAVTIDNIDEDAAQQVKDQEGDSTVSSVVPRLIRNTIDNPLNPTKGSKQVLRLDLAGLGGDEEFWLTQVNNTWYYPLWQSPLGMFVFSQRTQLAYGDTFNNEPFPLYKRFFPGGINSVRGYEARTLGPADENGHEYGGNKELVGNFELIFPLIDAVNLSGVVFFDVGNSFDDDESIDFGELRQAYGWGIRWRTPIAPIRFEVGYPIDKEKGEDSSEINFSFGAPL